MNISFKKECVNGLFTYLCVSGHSGNDTLGNDIFTVHYPKKYGNKFHAYLAFVGFLTANLEKHVLMRFSPFIKETFENAQAVSWKYEVVSSDFYGTGVDKGFTSISEDAHGINEFEQSLLFSINKLDKLKDLPEDAFGDTVSHVSVFGLSEARSADLLPFLQTSNSPDLSLFLQNNELFIHIAHGKEYGYFDSILIKSKTDIQETLDNFRNATDAGN